MFWTKKRTECRNIFKVFFRDTKTSRTYEIVPAPNCLRWFRWCRHSGDHFCFHSTLWMQAHTHTQLTSTVYAVAQTNEEPRDEWKRNTFNTLLAFEFCSFLLNYTFRVCFILNVCNEFVKCFNFNFILFLDKRGFYNPN